MSRANTRMFDSIRAAEDRLVAEKQAAEAKRQALRESNETINRIVRATHEGPTFTDGDSINEAIRRGK